MRKSSWLSLKGVAAVVVSRVKFINMYKYAYLWGVYMGNGKRTITLSVDSKIYEDYKNICDKKRWILSKQFENFIFEEIKKEGKKNDG